MQDKYADLARRIAERKQELKNRLGHAAEELDSNPSLALAMLEGGSDLGSIVDDVRKLVRLEELIDDMQPER